MQEPASPLTASASGSASPGPGAGAGAGAAPPALHAPGALPALDRPALMGTWEIAWSTLPMWRNKRDVTFTYTPANDACSVFASDVAYTALNANASSRSHVRGTERLVPGTEGAFVWRGDGWLCWCTSRWEVRGRGMEGAVEWCVISFAKTVFIPAGVDVLLRGGEVDAREAVVRGLIDAMRRVPDLEAFISQGQWIPITGT